MIILSRKRSGSQYEVILDGLWASCSIDTKQKIEDFFTQYHDYTVNATPVIISGNRVFSLYRFKHSESDIPLMLVITKSGVMLINKYCSTLNTEKDICTLLQKIFVRYLYTVSPEAYHDILKMIPLLAHHYYRYRDKSYIYNPNEMQRRYFCLLYPLNRDLSMGLNILLNQISIAKEDTIIKDRIYLNR